MKNLPLAEIIRRWKKLFTNKLVRMEICCNDEHGHFTGVMGAFDFTLPTWGLGAQFECRNITEDHDFIGLPVSFAKNGKWIHIGSRRIRIAGHGSGGNWCWEAVNIGRIAALSLFIDPSIRRLYQWTEIDCDLEDLWNASAAHATRAAFLARRGVTRKRRRRMARLYYRRLEQYVRNFQP